jgi:DNA repair protein RadD
MRDLRDYQKDGIEAIRQTIRQGVKRMVVQLPTGGGKTLMAAAIANGTLLKGNRLSFTCPRITLIDQTVESFFKDGICDVGVLQANHRMTNLSKPIQVCSIDTVRTRGFPDSKIVIFDEIHVMKKSHLTWMQECPDTIFIGLTATPGTRGMGRHFETMITVATMKELMEKGWLCGYRAFGVGYPDLTGLKTVAGDYEEGGLSERMSDKKLVGDVVDNWKKFHGSDRTLTFAVDRAHAKLIQERYEKAGIPAGYQDAYTKDDERRDIKKRFHDKSLPVVVSVGTLILGADWDCRCLQLCRPTKSRMMFVQIFGRGVRLGWPGSDQKDKLVFLDHTGTMEKELGYPEDIIFDRLDMGDKEKAPDRKPPLPKACSACGFIRPPRVATCPNCGFKATAVSGVEEVEGELVELTREPMKLQKKGAKRVWTMDEKAQFLAELKTYGLEHGYKPGWASRKYKDRFDVWPDWSIKDIAPAAAISTATSMWIRSQQIAWARSKKNPASHSGELDHRHDNHAPPQDDLFAPLELE